MAELSVQIGANIKQLKRALDQAEKEFKELEGAARSTNNQLGKQSAAAAGGVQKLGKTTSKTSLAAVEFGRVIGDLPYGIQGVANNIQQLAFVMGAGAGLQVAVSLVTSGLVILQKQMQKSTKNTDALTDATKGLVGSAESEIITLGALLDIARDENRTKDDRQKAIKKINDEYGDYLPNLTTENVNTNKVTESVNKLNEALLRQASIRGLQDVISKKTAELYEKQNKSITSQIGALDVLSASFKSGFGVLGATNIGIETLTETSKKAGEETKTLKQEIDGLVNSLRDLISQDISAGGISTGSLGGEDLINRSKATVASVIEPFNQIGTGISGAILTAAPAIQQGTEQIYQQLDAFTQNVQGLLKSGAITGIESIGQAIGNALANGSNAIEAVGASILGSLGDLAVNLGRILIAQGIAIEAFKKSLASLNPFVAIAAGTALVAIGSAFKATASNFASSGSTSGGSSRSFGGGGSISTGSSFSGSTSTGGGYGEVVFQISGTNLVGVLSRTLDRNRRLGGGLSLN